MNQPQSAVNNIPAMDPAPVCFSLLSWPYTLQGGSVKILSRVALGALLPLPLNSPPTWNWTEKKQQHSIKDKSSDSWESGMCEVWFYFIHDKKKGEEKREIYMIKV